MTFDANFLQGSAGGPLSLLGISLLLSVFAISISAIVLWRWRRHEAKIAVAQAVNGAAVDPGRQLLHEFEKNSRSVDDPLVTWTPDTLRKILETELPDAQVILVSNREP